MAIAVRPRPTRGRLIGEAAGQACSGVGTTVAGVARGRNEDVLFNMVREAPKHRVRGTVLVYRTVKMLVETRGEKSGRFQGALCLVARAARSPSCTATQRAKSGGQMLVAFSGLER